MRWPWTKSEPEPEAEPARPAVSTFEPVVIQTADQGALAVARSKGWWILRHLDTGALTRAIPQNSTGRIKFVDEPRAPEEFVPGDWIVKPFGTGPRRVLRQASFETDWEVVGEPTGEG